MPLKDHSPSTRGARIPGRRLFIFDGKRQPQINTDKHGLKSLIEKGLDVVRPFRFCLGQKVIVIECNDQHGCREYGMEGQVRSRRIIDDRHEYLVSGNVSEGWADESFLVLDK